MTVQGTYDPYGLVERAGETWRTAFWIAHKSNGTVEPELILLNRREEDREEARDAALSALMERPYR